LAVGGHGQDHWQHGVAEDPGGGAGGLAVVDAGGPFDDALDTGPAGCLEGGERRLGAGLVAQALGEHDRVFDGQGGALARGGGGARGGGIVGGGRGGGGGGGVWGGRGAGGGGGAWMGGGGGRAPRGGPGAGGARHARSLRAWVWPRAGSPRRGRLANHHTCP